MLNIAKIWKFLHETIARLLLQTTVFKALAKFAYIDKKIILRDDFLFKFLFEQIVGVKS